MKDIDQLPAGIPELRVAAMPADANAAGDIFGGWVMAQVDLAGSVAAMRRAHGRVVTVAVERLQFLRPVLVGDLVSCYARVIRVGRTSLSVAVEVFSERNPTAPESQRVAEAVVVYVAIDGNRRPRPVPAE